MPILTISHWFPIVTFCPVNNLPDFLYIYVTFEEFAELYAVRRRMRHAVSYRKLFMEEVAKEVLAEFPNANSVEVRLLTGRHVVRLNRS